MLPPISPSAPLFGPAMAAGAHYKAGTAIPLRIATTPSPGWSGGDYKSSRLRNEHIQRPQPQSSLSSLSTTQLSHFEQLMASEELPEPGPSYYAARRALWLQPPQDPPAPSSPSPSRIKLEALLNQGGAVESEEVWKAGLKNVWKGLVGGNQLRKRLPLSIVLKILQAGWLRDGTWPAGMVAPEPDDVMPLEPELPFAPSVPSYPSTNQSATPARYTPMALSSLQSDNEITEEDLDILGVDHMEDINPSKDRCQQGR